jgi:hypothetical protein
LVKFGRDRWQVLSRVSPKEISLSVFDQVEKHLFSILVETVGEGDIHVLAVFGTDDERPFAFVLIVKSLPDEGSLLSLVLAIELFGVAEDVEDLVGHGVGSRFRPMDDLQAFI